MQSSYVKDRALTTTASANLNPILARLMAAPSDLETVALDCAGCTRVNKCCDFQPFIANFLLGAILERGGSLPQSGNIIFQPLGLIPSGEFRARHAIWSKASPEERALKPESVHCSFYAGGRCSIWNERPGECSTYLCSTPTRARTAFSERAFTTETGLSQMALAYLGYSPDEMAAQIDFLNNPEHGLAAPPVEEMSDLYRRSWAWAQDLTAGQVSEWMKE